MEGKEASAGAMSGVYEEGMKLFTTAITVLCFSQVLGAERKLDELEEAVVVATLAERSWLLTPGSVSVVGRDDFTRFGGADMGDLGRYDPTVSVPFSSGSGDGTFGYGQTGYSGFNIRGVEGNRILMLVDGIRQPEQFISTSFSQDEGSAGGAGRDYYDPAMFETTEILKGSASGLYGSDALGGVVSFRTPDVDDFLVDSDRLGGLIRGQYFGGNHSVAGQVFGVVREGDVGFLLGYAGRWGRETENNGVNQPNPLEFESHSWLAKGEWRLNDWNKFKVSVESFERDRDLEILSATGFSTPFDKEILNWERQERNRVSIHWDHEGDDYRWFDDVRTHLYYQETLNESVNHSESIYGRVRDQEVQFETHLLGWQSLFSKNVSWGGMEHDFQYGLEASVGRSENRFWREDNGLPYDTNRVGFAPSETTRGSLLLQDEFKSVEDSRWSFVGGLRLDYYRIDPELSDAYRDRIETINLGRNQVERVGSHEQLTLAPRLDVLYQADEDTVGYFHYAYGVRNPTAEEISMIFDHPASGGNPAGSVTLPNPDLKEETSHAFELGVKRELEGGRFSAAGFYTRYDHFIENGVNTGDLSDDGRDILTTVNRGAVEIYGFELGGTAELGAWWDVMEGCSVGLKTGRTWGVDLENNTWLNSVDPWESVFWLGYRDAEDRFGVRITGTYVAGVKHVNDADGGPFFRPPSYFTLDASAYWRLRDDVTLQVGMNNLLDEQYWRWGSSRRGGGHSTNASSVDDRTTAPGVNGFVSVTYQF